MEKNKFNPLFASLQIDASLDVLDEWVNVFCVCMAGTGHSEHCVTKLGGLI